MANHKSAKKRIRQNETRRVSNKWKTSGVRTEIKKLMSHIDASDKANAEKQMNVVQSLIAKLAKTSAIKKATAARKTSRLASKVAKL